MNLRARFQYDKQWHERATQRISEAFTKAFHKATTEKEIQELNQLFQNIETSLKLIQRCDSKIHREKILPQYITQFETKYHIKILF